MESGSTDTLGEFLFFFPRAADDDFPCVVPCATISPSRPPSVGEVAANDPPELAGPGVAPLVVRKNLTDVIDTGLEFAGITPVWMRECSCVRPSFVVPESSARSPPERVFFGCDDAWYASSSHSPERSAVSGHDTGDPTPPPEVGENLISHGEFFDGSVSVPGKDESSSGEAWHPALDDIDSSPPGASVEGEEVAEDRGVVEGSFSDAGEEGGDGVPFALDVGDGPGSRNGQRDSEAEATHART